MSLHAKRTPALARFSLMVQALASYTSSFLHLVTVNLISHISLMQALCSQSSASYTQAVVTKIKVDVGEFVNSLIREVDERAASTSCGQVCAPYHSWAVRTEVSTGMYTLPNREQLLQKLNETGSTNLSPYTITLLSGFLAVISDAEISPDRHALIVPPFMGHGYTAHSMPFSDASSPYNPPQTNGSPERHCSIWVWECCLEGSNERVEEKAE